MDLSPPPLNKDASRASAILSCGDYATELEKKRTLNGMG